MTTTDHAPTRRTGRPTMTAIAVAMTLVASLIATVLGAPADGQPLPRAAVAMGDSFISGEGAGDYQPVVDFRGDTRPFPGWSADNNDPYFCHRSANASIEVAALAGIQRRFNNSCSGGVTNDMVNPSYRRDRGRLVEPQLDQLKRIAETNDIDLVLYGMGANDVGFSRAAQACISGFLTDAYLGWWEFWVPIVSPDPINDGACSRGDFPDAGDLARATDDLEQSLRDHLDTLDEVDADGDHRIVIQNYVNPMPTRFDREYQNQNGRNDRRDKFRALGRERYAAGCPVHESALPLAQSMTESLGAMVAEAQHRVMLDRPDADIVFLDVIDAFNGSHLCERNGSPANALHTPVRVRTSNGTFVNSIDGKNKSDLDKLFDNCENNFQRCQESLHPNATGHRLLGQCLSGAWTATRPVVWCNGSGGRVSPMGRGPSIDPNLSMRLEEGLDRNGRAVLVLTASWNVDLADAPGRRVTSTSVRFNTGSTTLATRSSMSGAVTTNVRCSTSSTTIYASITVTLDDGRRVNGSGSTRATCPGSGGSDPGLPKR
ncbi:MAG: hypothetical protein AAGA93_12935 [Actinomycetota bacterium]